MAKIMIVAGEPSGDSHAARLVNNLKENSKLNFEFYGMGGDKMQQTGVHLVQHIQNTSVMGIFELISKLPFLYSVLFKLKKILKTNPPDLLILVDYQAFNLKLAKIAKKLNIKTLFYIGPQVWAWRQHRVKKMRQIIDHMAVIFPFEAELYQKNQMNATYVGHPLINSIKTKLQKSEFFEKYKISQNHTLIGFLPGSRSSEVINHLPIFKQTINELAKQKNLTFAVSRYNQNHLKLKQYFDELPKNVKIIDNDYYDLIKFSNIVVVASGTATLETALLKTPMIMVVKVSKLSYFIYKKMIKTPFIGIVNIIAGKKIIEELIQQDATPQNIVNLIKHYFNSEKDLQEIQKGFDEVEKKLTVKPQENLTQLVFNILNGPK